MLAVRTDVALTTTSFVLPRLPANVLTVSVMVTLLPGASVAVWNVPARTRAVISVDPITYRTRNPDESPVPAIVNASAEVPSFWKRTRKLTVRHGDVVVATV